MRYMHSFDVCKYVLPVIDMKSKSLKITISAAMSALTVVFMYLAAILPTGRLGFLGASSLFGIAAVIESGISGGISVYAVSCVLGFLLVPSKDVVLVYAIFFGYYPIVKSIAEKNGKKLTGWFLKLCIMNMALTVLLLGFSQVFYDIAGITYTIYISYIIVNAVFVLFDIGLTGVIGFYMAKVHRKIKHR